MADLSTPQWKITVMTGARR